MTELATRPSQTSDLSIVEGQTFWTDKQIATLKQLGVKDASNGDLAVFFHQSVRTGLDPFAKQIYMIGRWSREGTKWTIQTGIDGYRLVARRASDQRRELLEYEDTLWCGEDGQWRDVWLSNDPPAAAKVTVLRNGARFGAVAVWREYVQTTKDGKPNSMWERMGANQLAKCAEALALRKAFPQDLSGLYTDAEMGQADVPAAVAPQQPQRTAADRLRAAVQPDEPAPLVESEPVKATAERVDQGITKAQLTALNAALSTDIGFTTRDEKLAYLSGELGRDIGSSAELTKAEASLLIDKIKREYAEPAEAELLPEPAEDEGGWPAVAEAGA
jgi:phage recombination protein Bet